jgi:hypothetical protein
MTCNYRLVFEASEIYLMRTLRFANGAENIVNINTGKVVTA